MKYNVILTIQVPEEISIDKLIPSLEAAPFPVNTTTEDGLLTIFCLGIETQGITALPEALRRAQVGLSPIFRSTLPFFAERGGLLWSDITDVHVRAVE